MDIYSSYLTYKYLRSSTKTAIIHDLDRRAVSEGEAHTVVRSLPAEDVAELLDSRNAALRSAAWKFLGELAHHESTAEAVLRIYPCERIVSFLRSEDSDVLESAIYALAWITEWQDGAKAAVAANMLDYLTELLGSRNPEVRRWTCTMLAQVANHEYLAVAALDRDPTMRLVSLLRDDSLYVIESAIFALAVIAENPDGARTAVDANMLDYVSELLKSPNDHTRRWTCKMLAHLSFNKSTASLIFRMKPCERLPSLLRDGNTYVVENAIFALAAITECREGSEAAVNEGLLDGVIELLDSPNHHTRRWACKALGEMAHNESTAPAVLASSPFMRLVLLLRDADAYVIENAIFALSEMTQWLQGIQDAVDAKILESVLELLGSPNARTCKWTCYMLGNLAHNELTVAAVLEVNSTPSLVSLLQDKDADVLQSAIFALSGIIKYPHGRRIAVAAKMLAYLKQLLKSPHVDARTWACKTLGQFAHHRQTAMAVLDVKPCTQLASLLRDSDEETRESASYALARITEWPDGARDVVNAKAPEYIVGLLESGSTAAKGWACRILGNLAHHKCTAAALLGFNACRPLVSLLGHPDVTVSGGAVFALAEISQSLEGAMAVALTDFLQHVSALTELSRRDVQFHACMILGNLFRSSSIA
ncbi:armadillo-type protein [Mycena latifolia]|nr:armadillo-type protein [Mycena latifolia]